MHTDIRNALSIFSHPDGLLEIRAPKPINSSTRRWVKTFSADQLDAAAAEIADADAKARYQAIYCTLNPVQTYQGNAAKDENILLRHRMLVDCDPVRPANTSADDAEHKSAIDRALAIRQYLTDGHWPSPIVADSSNGGHLIYAVNLPNDPESNTLINRCLKALQQRFGDDAVSVDTSVSNASRITKVYGTISRKGEATTERPHRRSQLLEIPDILTPVPADLLRELAGMETPAQAAIRRAIQLIRNAADGEKHHSLNKAAYLLGGYVAGGVVNLDAAREALRQAIRQKPNVADLDAADQTIEDGLKAGQTRPTDGKTKRESSTTEGNKGNKVTGLNNNENTCYPEGGEEVTKVTSPRPYYFTIHLNGRKEGGIGLKNEELDEDTHRKPGLWFVGVQKVSTPDGDELVYSEPVWVCIPFEILATADDGRGHGYCIAIRFKALHGHQHTWPIPRALLVTDGREILQRLYEMGFKAMDDAVKANKHIRANLNHARPERQALAVSKTGWADSRFVLPDKVFGADPDNVFYQTDDPKASPYTVKGSLAGWRDHVAKVIEPYDLPVFSISASFAAPLLSLLNIPSGGFHFMGTSTTGKTTAQQWGLSVWGKHKDLQHNWHGTKVGFELTAAAHSDAVLMLDEIGQADPREVGDLIYMIFNEAGRMRGNARLTHRSLPRWQLLLLSSGEKSLEEIMQSVGKTPMAGQELRLLHIPASNGDGCGILNGLTDSHARGTLIRQVNTAITQHHGHPIQHYLTRLAHPDTLTQIPDADQHVKALTLRLTQGIESDEVKRAALRFALVGFAGELASDWQITGWSPGRAAAAAEIIFHRWLAKWGTATRHDETTFLDHLEVWLTGNSTGHFAEVDTELFLTVNAERALTGMRPFYGYVAPSEAGRVFYLNAAGWQALTKGFTRSLAIETLTAANRLEKDPHTNKGRVIRIGDRNTTGRYYVIREAGHAE